MKVNQLINFQEIQDVIEIGKIKNEKELVEEYVISPSLEEELLDLLSVLDSQKTQISQYYRKLWNWQIPSFSVSFIGSV